MIIDPGATIGILGGGQLGRMTAMAARTLGYRVHVLDPDPECPARPVSDRCVTASFDDADAAAELASRCDVVTLEIERVSVASLRAAQRHCPVRPGPDTLTLVQDRGVQRAWLRARGAPQGPWALATSEAELAGALAALGGDCYVKSCRDGYDGRGQFRARAASDAGAAWAALGGGACVAEGALDLAAELSVMVARSPSGETAVYPPALNHHENRVLDWSVLPADLAPELLARASEAARDLAASMGLEGIVAVEMFVTRGGALFVNELAPRPHNSFHATTAACATSQFEQHVRAVCDLPLGATELLRPAAIVNLLGDLWQGAPPRFERALAMPGVSLHLYGKREARPGRKMGHLTAAGATPAEAVAWAKRARDALRG
jgi:5-(carboxyamino)imidazole ribonucleotide synthase